MRWMIFQAAIFAAIVVVFAPAVDAMWRAHQGNMAGYACLLALGAAYAATWTVCGLTDYVRKFRAWRRGEIPMQWFGP